MLLSTVCLLLVGEEFRRSCGRNLLAVYLLLVVWTVRFEEEGLGAESPTSLFQKFCILVFAAEVVLNSKPASCPIRPNSFTILRKRRLIVSRFCEPQPHCNVRLQKRRKSCFAGVTFHRLHYSDSRIPMVPPGRDKKTELLTVADKVHYRAAMFV